MHTRRGLDVGQESSHPCCAFIPEVKKKRVSPWWKIGVKKFLSTTCETALSPNDRVTWHLRAKSSSSITFATRISLRAFSYFYLVTFFQWQLKRQWKINEGESTCVLFCSRSGRLEDAHGLTEWDLRESMDRTRSVVRAGTKSWHAVARFHSQTRGPGSCTTQHISKSIPGDEGTSRAILDDCTKRFLY